MVRESRNRLQRAYCSRFCGFESSRPVNQKLNQSMAWFWTAMTCCGFCGVWGGVGIGLGIGLGHDVHVDGLV